MTNPDNISLVTTPPSLLCSPTFCHAEGVSVANGQSTFVAGALALSLWHLCILNEEQSIKSSSSVCSTADVSKDLVVLIVLHQNCSLGSVLKP